MDLTLPLRQAIVSLLRTDTDLTALVPAERVYGERSPASPTFPFVRYGVSDIGATGGATSLHVFSKSGFTDQAANIAARIVEALDGKTLATGSRKVTLTWPERNGTQIIPDSAEADVFHAIVRFDVSAPRAC